MAWTARYAPTGSNKQQVNWMVFQKSDDVRKLATTVIDFMKMMLPVTTDEATVRRFRLIAPGAMSCLSRGVDGRKNSVHRDVMQYRTAKPGNRPQIGK